MAKGDGMNVGVINEEMVITFRNGKKYWDFQNLEIKSAIHIDLGMRHKKMKCHPATLVTQSQAGRVLWTITQTSEQGVLLSIS